MSTKKFVGTIASLLCVEVMVLSIAAHATPPKTLLLSNGAATAAQTGDEVKVPPFDVNVTLTEGARRRLESTKETIIVSVYIFGNPKPGVSAQVNEVGLVDLTKAQIELSRARRARFNNLSVPAAKRDQLLSRDYNVNVNVYSGRRSSSDNVLSCDFFDGKISGIQPGITLKCGLIREYNGRYISSSHSTTGTPPSSDNAVPALK